MDTIGTCAGTSVPQTEMGLKGGEGDDVIAGLASMTRKFDFNSHLPAPPTPRKGDKGDCVWDDSKRAWLIGGKPVLRQLEDGSVEYVSRGKPMPENVDGEVQIFKRPRVLRFEDEEPDDGAAREVFQGRLSLLARLRKEPPSARAVPMSIDTEAAKGDEKKQY